MFSYIFMLLPIAIIALFSISIIWYYRFWKSFKYPRWIYWAIQFVLASVFIYTMAFRNNTPEFISKKALLFISAVYFISIAYSSVICIVVKLVSFISAKISLNGKMTRVLKGKRILPAISLCFTLLLGAVGYINMGILQEKDITIEINKESVNDSITSVMISDTHLGTGLYADKLDELVEKINGMNPDVIFMVGDIVDESTTNNDISIMTREFSRLKSTYGTYFVFGNHEKYKADEKIADYFEQSGITVLRDEVSVIADDITVIGRMDYYENPQPVDEIIKNNNVDTSKPVIVLSHEPLGLNDLSKAGADLSFSGHTHGEQFPLTRAFVRIGNDMVYGVEKFGNMTAYTSSGAGGWGMHYKFPSGSEIVKAEIIFK